MSETKTINQPEVMVAGELSLKEKAEQVDENIRTSLTTVSKGFYTLAFNLAELSDKQLYAHLGYDSFNHYIEEGVQYSRRQAYELVRLARMVKALAMPEEQAMLLGSSKLMRIAPLVIGNDAAIEEGKLKPSAEVERLIEHAPNLSVREVDDAVKQIKKKYGKSTEKEGTNQEEESFRFEAYATGETAGNVKRAFEIAAEELGMTGNPNERSHCIVHIIEEWLSMKGDDQMPLDSAVQLLERQYGVQLEVVNKTESLDSLLTASNYNQAVSSTPMDGTAEDLLEDLLSNDGEEDAVSGL